MGRVADFRREFHQLFRFCVVGAAGFLADAGVLALLHYGVGLGPLGARAISAPLAVFLTYNLNRSWTFPAGRQSFLLGMALYSTVQCAGLLSNLAIYSVAITAMPSPLSEPMVAFVSASAMALAINYAGSRFVALSPPGIVKNL